MQYLLLVYAAEEAYTDDERRECFEQSTQLCHDLRAVGQYLLAAPLHAVKMATSVRVREGKRMVTDGPFAETHEQLGGFYLIEAANLDEAIGVAERIPGAKKGTIEIRPVVHLAGLPTNQQSG